MRPIEFMDSLSTERIEWEKNGSRFFAQAPDYTIYVLDSYNPPREYTPASNWIMEDVKRQVLNEVSRRRFQEFISHDANAGTGATQRRVEQEEVSAIASYMADEMNKNAASSDVQEIRRLNQMGNELCPIDTWWERMSVATCQEFRGQASLAALMAWASLVRTNGRWDHKPIIAKRFIRADSGYQTQENHLYIAPDGKQYAVYYDVWSNIHYGYVGTACGFSPDDLLDGAGLEQIGTDLKAGRLPSRKGTQGGLQSLDDPDDSAAIKVGIDLYQHNPTRVTAEELLDRVVTNPLFIRPRGTPKK